MTKEASRRYKGIKRVVSLGMKPTDEMYYLFATCDEEARPELIGYTTVTLDAKSLLPVLRIEGKLKADAVAEAMSPAFQRYAPFVAIAESSCPEHVRLVMDVDLAARLQFMEYEYGRVIRGVPSPVWMTRYAKQLCEAGGMVIDNGVAKAASVQTTQQAQNAGQSNVAGGSLTATGDLNAGRDIHIYTGQQPPPASEPAKRKSILGHLTSWYGLLLETVATLIAWYTLYLQYPGKVWFFWLK